MGSQDAHVSWFSGAPRWTSCSSILAEPSHVHHIQRHDWLRHCVSAGVLSYSRVRVGLPYPPRQTHSALQHLFLLWCHWSGLDHVWNFQDSVHVGMANPFSIAGCYPFRPAYVHLLGSRISSVSNGLLLLSHTRLIKSSLRWLIANGKRDEAVKILTKWHAAGQEFSPLVEYEVAQIEKALEMERNQESHTSWVALIRTAPMRRRTLLAFILGFFSQWNGISVVTYYLTLVLNTIGITAAKDQTLINGLLQIFNFAAAVFAGAMMVDRFGRRRLLLLSTAGLCLSYVAWTALTSHFVSTHDQSAGRAVVAFIFIAFFFYDIAWTPLPQAYTIEIFPFTTRSRGLTTALISSYVGLICAQLINPVGLAAIGWRYYIVFCCILAGLTTAIFCLFPETKGRTLEQITEIFDGKSVTVAADDIISKGKLDVMEHVEIRDKRDD